MHGGKGKYYKSNEKVKFDKDITIGSPKELFKITISSEPLPDEPQLPTVYKLEQNYPNPFNPCTTVSFDLPNDAAVNLTIYNIKGQLIRRFTGKKDNFWVKTDIVWDGKDEQGKAVPSGVYFYRLSYGKHSVTKKMLLLR